MLLCRVRDDRTPGIRVVQHIQGAHEVWNINNLIFQTEVVLNNITCGLCIQTFGNSENPL